MLAQHMMAKASENIFEIETRLQNSTTAISKNKPKSKKKLSLLYEIEKTNNKTYTIPESVLFRVSFILQIFQKQKIYIFCHTAILQKILYFCFFKIFYCSDVAWVAVFIPFLQFAHSNGFVCNNLTCSGKNNNTGWQILWFKFFYLIGTK